MAAGAELWELLWGEETQKLDSFMSKLIFELLMRRQRRLELERVALCMLCTYIAARQATAARRIRGHEREHRSRPHAFGVGFLF